MTPEGQEKEPILSEEEAREKANMIRAKMSMSPETGKIPRRKPLPGDYEIRLRRREKEATAEDYEIALKMLDELEKMAEENPGLVKKLLEYTEISLASLVWTFTALLTMEPKKVLKIWNEHRISIFNDARSELERLKKASEEFGRKNEESYQAEE